jgi:CheY-like chemotaxis protein
MTNNTTGYSVEANDCAEGTPDNREPLEPKTQLRTSIVPRVQDMVGTRTGETGINRLAQPVIEGRDRIEAQDSSLTTDEIRFEKSHARDRENRMSSETASILVVEDTLELGEVILATLEGMGLHAVHETHGKSGLERLKAMQPKVVLLDIGLPDITGWKMLGYIKEHYAGQKAPMPAIIVITAYGDPANRLIGKLQNIHSYLLKPFTPDQVERVVKMALRGESPNDPPVGGISSATS